MKMIKLFPTIEEVFEKPNEYYKMIFFPLLTVETDKGKKLHFITVQGNGDPDDEFLDINMNYNYIIFKVNNNKYSFEGDLNEVPNFNKLKDWYKEAERNYTENKEKYTTDKEFIRSEKLRMSSNEFEHNFYVNGVLNYWITRDKFKETNKFIQGSAYTDNSSKHEREPYEVLGGNFEDEYTLEYLEEVLEQLNLKIEQLNFIGKLTGYNYSSFGEDDILLFYNEEENKVIQYFDWS